MTIEFACQECGRKVTAPDNAVGKKAKCLTCGAIIFVPSASGQKFSGLDDPRFEVPPAEAKQSPPAGPADESTGGRPGETGPVQNVAGNGQLMDVSDLIHDADQMLNKPQVPSPESSDGIDFVLEAADYGKYAPSREKPSSRPKPPPKKPPPVPRAGSQPATPASPSAQSTPAPATNMAPEPPPIPPTFYPQDNMTSSGEPISLAPEVIAPAPIVEASGSLLEDCLGAFPYGMRNFGSVVVLVIVMSLASVGMNVVGQLFGAALAEHYGWLLRIIALVFVGIHIAMGGWAMSLQVDIVDVTIQGSRECPALPQWDFNDHFKLGLRVLGVLIVYVMPVITLPLLPLGVLALGYTGDGRAFNLIWAVQSAFKRPGQLVITWLFIIAYTVAMGILFVIAMVLIGVITGPNPTMGGTIVAGVCAILAFYVISGLHLSMCSRCVGSLGRRCADLVKSIPQIPNPAISLAFLVGGCALTFGVYAMLAVSVAGLGSMLNSAGDKVFRTSARPPGPDNQQVASGDPQGGKNLLPYQVSFGNLRVVQTADSCTVQVNGKPKSFSGFTSQQLEEFQHREEAMQELRRCYARYATGHRQMATSLDELLRERYMKPDQVQAAGCPTNYVIVTPLAFSFDTQTDIVIYSDAVVYGGAILYMNAQGELDYVWADELQTRLSQEAQRRAPAATTPRPTYAAGTPTHFPTPPVYVRPSPTPTELSAAETDLVTLADALKAYAVTKSGQLPDKIDDLLSEGRVKKSAAVSSADGATPMAIVAGKYDRNNPDVLAYDPVPVKDGIQAGKIRFIRTAGDPEYLAPKDFEAELLATRSRAHLRAIWPMINSFNERNRRPPALLDELVDAGLTKDDATVRGLGEDAAKYVIVADATWGSSDIIAFDPQPCRSKYIGMTAEGDIRSFQSMDALTHQVAMQKERIAFMRAARITPTPAAGAKPTPAVVDWGGKKVVIDWPVEGWVEVGEHPFKDVCQVVREIKSSQYSAVVGVSFGPEASKKTDQAFADYRKQLLDFWVQKSGVKERTESKQTIGEVEYDRINSKKGSQIATVLIGIRQGRCVAYWYVSNTTNVFKQFTDAFDKVTVKEGSK